MQTNTAVVEPTVEHMSSRIRCTCTSYDWCSSCYVCSPDFPGGLYSGERYSISDTKFIQPGIYIRECFSDAITDQHFYYDSFVAGNCSTTWDLCCDLPCRICKKRK